MNDCAYKKHHQLDLRSRLVKYDAMQVQACQSTLQPTEVRDRGKYSIQNQSKIQK